MARQYTKLAYSVIPPSSIDHPRFSLSALACHTLRPLARCAVVTLVAHSLAHPVSPYQAHIWLDVGFFIDGLAYVATTLDRP